MPLPLPLLLENIENVLELVAFGTSAIAECQSSGSDEISQRQELVARSRLN